MKIIALNLPRDLSDEALAELFAEHGKIAACNVVSDTVTGNSKGFGFVEMPNKREATTAIKRLHNTKLGENRIRVKLANRPYNDRPVAASTE